MERVGILINKLQEQLTQKADVKNMLVTVQMLQVELLQLNREGDSSTSTGVSVMVPFNSATQPSPPKNGVEKVVQEPAKPAPPPAKVTEEEKPVESQVNTFSRSEPAGWSLNPVEVPTLAHQEKLSGELNDTISKEGGSLNDSLKENTPEVAHALKDAPIKDLKKAISINDRHLFIHELFRDDETMYERSIKTINSFYIFAEAEYWIQRELKLKLGWDTRSNTVLLFDQLVKRRFA